MAIKGSVALNKNDGSSVEISYRFVIGVDGFPGEEVFDGTGTNPGSLAAWAEEADGSGTTYAIGDTIPAAGMGVVYYAIWEVPEPVPYLVTDQDLTAIADAIRTKGGTSAQLAFPAGFVSAIGDIQTGPAAHTVTVQLSYPRNPEGFGSCVLRDGGENGEQVGEITSATGSATVAVSTGILYIALTGSGVHPSNLLSSYLVTGDIGVNSSSSSITLIVGGDGSISIEDIDWDN